MSQFDPYHRWLGISVKDQPVHHYRLLGLEAGESDPDVIDSSANRQMSYVAKHASGPHAALASQLLNEIAAARLCLLNPGQKARYDAEWLPRIAAHAAGATPPSAEELAITQMVVETPVTVRRRSRSKAGWPVWVLGGGIALATGALALVDWNPADSGPSATAAADTEPEPATAAPHIAGGETGGDVAARPPAGSPIGPSPAESKPPPVAPATPVAAQPRVPRTHLAGEEGWTVLVPTEATSVVPGACAIQPDGTILVGGASPEADSYTLLIQDPPQDITALRIDVLPDPGLPANGPGRSESGNFVLTDLRVDFAAEGGPSEPVRLAGGSASFYQTNENGYLSAGGSIDDPAAAPRSGWAIYPECGKPQHAVFETAKNIPGGPRTDLLVRLDFLYGGRLTLGKFKLSVTGADRPVVARLVPAAGAGTPRGTKLPIPDVEALKTARGKVKQIFKSEFAQLQRSRSTPQEKSAIAKAFLHAALTMEDRAAAAPQGQAGVPPDLSAALELKDDSTDRFGLLQEALETAGDCGDADTALTCIDVLARTFEIPVLKWQAEALTRAAESSRVPSLWARKGVERALELSAVAVRQEDAELASLCLRAAARTARSYQDKTYILWVAERQQRLKEELRFLEQGLAARAALQSQPDDPRANLDYGRYLCLVRGDWQAGLAALSRSDQPRYAAAAQAEGLAQSTGDWIALGEAWAELAGAEKGEYKPRLDRQSRYWFEAALPGATGLQVADLTRRISRVSGLAETRFRPGLVSTHYNGMDFDEEVGARLDQRIDFNFGWGGSSAKVIGDAFSIRWEGALQAPHSGKYTLGVRHDDGVRLSLDGRLLVNVWRGAWNEWRTVDVELDDRPHRFQLDYFEFNNTANVTLQWRRPGQSEFETIPPSAFSHDTRLFEARLARIAPGFTLTADRGECLFAPETRGRTTTLRTHPAGQAEPIVFHGSFDLAAECPSVLSIETGHWSGADWELVVRANGEVIRRTIIGSSTCGDEWTTVRVDLTRFRGQAVDLEIAHQANDWNAEYAFWRRIAVRPEPPNPEMEEP